MKALASTVIRQSFSSEPGGIRQAEPALELATPKGTLEIRRFLRYLRKSRRYNFTRDFVY